MNPQNNFSEHGFTSSLAFFIGLNDLNYQTQQTVVTSIFARIRLLLGTYGIKTPNLVRTSLFSLFFC